MMMLQPFSLKILAEERNGYWVATCLNFNLVAEGQTPEQACEHLLEAVNGYIKTVTDTEDKLSIIQLFNRPAPIGKRIKFWMVHQLKIIGHAKAFFCSNLKNAHA